MSKNKESKDMSIDFSDFSDDEMRKLFKRSTAGVRRHGYDDSTDVTVDYTPSAEDAIKANKIVESDWDEDSPWGKVREKVKGSYDEEDLIYRMRRGASAEFLKRQEDRLSGMENNIAKNSESPADNPVEKEETEEINKMPSEPVQELEETPDVFNEPAAQTAKAKAQAHQGKKTGFQAGDVSSIKSTMGNSSATDGEASAQAVYGNVSTAEAANEHANNLLTNYKSGIKYGSQK